LKGPIDVGSGQLSAARRLTASPVGTGGSSQGAADKGEVREDKKD